MKESKALTFRLDHQLVRHGLRERGRTCHVVPLAGQVLCEHGGRELLCRQARESGSSATSSQHLSSASGSGSSSGVEWSGSWSGVGRSSGIESKLWRVGVVLVVGGSKSSGIRKQ